MTGHHIEQQARVYLVFADGRWRIDLSKLDDRAFDGLPTSSTEACGCGTHRACEAAAAEADGIPGPNPAELVDMLSEAISELGLDAA